MSGRLGFMDQRANGHARAHPPGADRIIEHLARFAARLSGPYQASVITTGQVPYLRVVSQLDPELSEDVLCDFSTDPPDYLTAAGQRLGAVRGPASAAADRARLLQGTGTGGR